jgi:prophage regulatory protein
MANLIRLPEVLKITGLSRAGIYKAMAAGTFPTQIPIGDRAVAWLEDEIFEWRDTRIEEARNQAVQHELDFGDAP